MYGGCRCRRRRLRLPSRARALRFGWVTVPARRFDAIAQGGVRSTATLQSRPHVGWRLMRTNFTPTQLTNPHLTEAEKNLRVCVHCGICTATCPTYVLL